MAGVTSQENAPQMLTLLLKKRQKRNCGKQYFRATKFVNSTPVTEKNNKKNRKYTPTGTCELQNSVHKIYA